MSASGCLYGRSDENVSYCSGTQARCSTECRNSKSYGAIAYSSADEGYGWSESWNSQQKAEQVAMQNCSQHGSACEVLVWYYNSCGAVAAGTGAIGWGQNDSEAAAKTDALKNCKDQGGKGCAIKVAKCSR